MSATPARRAALEVLRAVRGGQLADRALFTITAQLAVADRAWVQELVYGTLRLRGRLDHIAAAFVRRPLASLDADVLDLLRLGCYQLLEMDSVPGYAAVSATVELAKLTVNAGVAGLVNGVLRAIERSGIPAFPDFTSEPVAHLATWGSHPRWLVERWVARWGPDATRALIELDNRRPSLYLRPVGVSVAEARESLAGRGIGAEVVDSAPDALLISSAVPVETALAAVPAVVQDPAAGCVTRYVAAPDGALVADLCAAPGGKTLGLAAGNGGGSPRYVLAADGASERMPRLRANVQRLPPLPVGMVVADARRPPLRSADVVLLDVPCTGTGTLRRHPDARWRLQPRDLAVLGAVQRALLAAAAPLVVPGGLLVYATCSLEPEENELQVEAFLSQHPEFTREPPDTVAAALLDSTGQLSVLPQATGFDGAFAARLRRGGRAG